MTQNPLTFRQFSKEILESGDIDPDYIFMREFARKNKFSKQRLLDWVLLKTVIYKSTSELEVLLCGKKIPDVSFGQERNKAKNRALEYAHSINRYFDYYGKYKLVEKLAERETALELLQRVPGIGPWASWKLMDLIDCVLGYDTQLHRADFRKAYQFPLKGLLMVNNHDEEAIGDLNNELFYRECMAHVKKLMPDVKKTPHNNNRGIRLNEIETCLCKYHSYMHGHYHPGKDLEHLKKAIQSSEHDVINSFKWSI